MKNYILLLLQVYCLAAYSQNLIFNGGFETHTQCPNFLGQIRYVTGWKDQNSGSVDYFNTCSISSYKTLPNDYLRDGIQPHGGDGYAGFVMVQQSYFEFIQTKLIKPLISGKSYCLSFFIRKAQKYPYSLNQLAFLLSEKENKLTNSDFYSDSLIRENNLILYQLPNSLNYEWTEIRVLCKPKAKEQFLSIGINKPKGINGSYLHFKGQDSYYYIDDISLKELKKGENCSCQPMDSLNVYTAAIGKPLVLQNINFQLNSAILLSNSYPELNKLAEYLKQKKSLNIGLSGYTDNVGKEVDNLKLSEHRARAVSDYLIQQGIARNRITYKGYGSIKPIVPNTSEENRSKNRRVEIIFN